MKRQILEFKCDCEGCDKKLIVEGEVFPYEQNWRFLYNLNFKVAPGQTGIKEVKEKHFCSPLCFVKFVATQLGLDLSQSKKKVKD